MTIPKPLNWQYNRALTFRLPLEGLNLTVGGSMRTSSTARRGYVKQQTNNLAGMLQSMMKTVWSY